MITAKYARIKAHEKTKDGQAILEQRKNLELGINQAVAVGKLSVETKDFNPPMTDTIADDNVEYLKELGYAVSDKKSIRW